MRPVPPVRFVISALASIVLGVTLTVLALHVPTAAGCVLVLTGWLLTCSGLGVFQVVVFHHCSHGTVFRTRERNRLAGRIISAVLLFKHFDAYQREHMLHHSAKKLLTEEDEFADFVFGMIGLEPALPRRELWRRVIISVASPHFHFKFLSRRVKASLRSPDRTHNLLGLVVWMGLAGLAVVSGQWPAVLLAWVLPVTVLLQIATVFRILCEHRFPTPDLIIARGKEFVCRSTAGVFPGKAPPPPGGTVWARAVAWTAWWLDMLCVQLPIRLFVLVGDAPCHDFHHRHPATRTWTDYIRARQRDVDAGCPGFPLDYLESWGLFRAIDENLASLAATPAHALAAASVRATRSRTELVNA
jgi:fatty acid desaturase